MIGNAYKSGKNFTGNNGKFLTVIHTALDMDIEIQISVQSYVLHYNIRYR